MNMKKIVAVVAAVVMLISVMPLSALAGTIDMSNAGCDFYNLISKTDYNLAPGAVESEIVLNDDAGANRNVLHVIEVDLSNPNISIMPTYKGLNENSDLTQDSQQGSQELTLQAAHVEENLGLNVVGGMNTNLRYGTSAPYGVLVWNGVVYADERDANGNSTCQTFLSVTKEGVASLHSASEPIPEDSYNAISANFGWIIKDGVSQYKTDDHADSGRAPRSVIGIKADGTLVLMMNDGRQAPYSAGSTMRELAEWMLAMGCVDAVNCDGGGSSTFISEREGTGELTMKSSPSDGYIRPTLGGILVISKAVADGKFHHAAVSTDVDYVTPGSSVTFTALGADSAGGPAEIPAEGISWQLADASMGTIVDGVFTSNGTTGTAIAQMLYNGEVVGEASVDVVVPTAISFTKATYVVPYGKTITIAVKATINEGRNEVVLKDGDIALQLADSTIGTLTGNRFTSVSEDVGVTHSAITATFVGTEVTATTTVTLGKGSEIVEDFEDRELGTIEGVTYVNAHSYGHGDSFVEVVDATTGKVRNGDKAFAIHVDASEYRYYDTFSQNKVTGLNIGPFEKASKIGMWMYIPEEAVGLQFAFTVGNADDTAKGTRVYLCDQEYIATIEAPGWRYLSVDVSGIAYANMRIDRMDLFLYETDADGYDTLANSHNLLGEYTIYIDDITADYSDAVEDREIPEFGNVYISNDDAGIVMNGQTIIENNIGVYVQAQDFVADNTVGLDIKSAKAYVDGVLMTNGFTCDANGKLSLSGLALSEGAHTFRFEIADANGNVGFIQRHVVVDATEAEAPIVIVPQDPDADDLPVGSAFWIDVKAQNIEKIQEVVTTIELDGVHDWVLDHMVVADGFAVSYVLDESTNDVTLTITKTGSVAATGEAVLVSIPIHTWEYKTFYNNKTQIDPSETAIDWANQNWWARAVKLRADYGIVTYTDGTSNTFSVAPLTVESEVGIAENAEQQGDGYHVHKAEAVEDKAPTCTENGYTGRTVCVGCLCGVETHLNGEACPGACGSPVNWGTVIPATGHTYVLKDLKLVCEDCGAVNTAYNGFWQDANGWAYILEGAAMTGWVNLDDGWHYFKGTGYAPVGTANIDGRSYEFEGEQGKSIGAWGADGRFYYSHRYYNNTWATIKGNTYYFNGSGYPETGDRAIIRLEEYMGAYSFDENGVFLGNITGVFCDTSTGLYHYAIDGVLQAIGLFQWEGDYYYAKGNYSLAVTDWYVGSNSFGIPAGTYTFGADAKMVMINGIVEKDGTFYYYIDCVPQSGLGLVLVDGKYYYVRANGTLVANATWYVDADNKYGFPAGNYTFGADASMQVEVEEPDEDVVVDTFVTGNITFETVEKADGTHKLVISGTGVMPAKKNMSEATFYEYASTVTEIVFEEGVTVVGYSTFNGWTALESVSLPSTLVSIDGEAFRGCTALKSIDIPDSVTTLGYGAFWGAGLESIVIPESVTDIKNYVFYRCADLTSAEIYGSTAYKVGSKTYRATGARMFSECSNLSNIVLGDVITLLNTYTFHGAALTEFTVPARVKFVYDAAFHSNTKMTKFVMEEGVTYLGWAALFGCSSLTDVTIPETITGGNIATWAFGACTSLESIELPSKLTNLKKRTFSGCTSLKSIELPAGVTTLGDRVFIGCTALESVKLSNITKIDVQTFNNCPSLTSITIPETVTSIGDLAFRLNESLETVYIDSATIAAGLASNASYGNLIRWADTVAIRADIDTVSSYVTKVYTNVGTVTIDGVEYTTYSK
ncbi:MAG: leucine-rich repeat protein [Clostridia bacterium]|nr:leucine-rich repeat protein [Clostridia bacterium]